MNNQDFMVDETSINGLMIPQPRFRGRLTAPWEANIPQYMDCEIAGHPLVIPVAQIKLIIWVMQLSWQLVVRNISAGQWVHQYDLWVL